MHLVNPMPSTSLANTPDPTYTAEIQTVSVHSEKKAIPVTSHESSATGIEISALSLLSVQRLTSGPIHIRPSQATFTNCPVSLKQHSSWLLTGICLPQEARIKSLKFSLLLLILLPDNAQYKLQTSKFWMNPNSSEGWGGGGMFWQSSSHQWNWRKPYHMNHLKIRSVWTQHWKMYRREQTCIGGGMNRMSSSCRSLPSLVSEGLVLKGPCRLGSLHVRLLQWVLIQELR